MTSDIPTALRLAIDRLLVGVSRSGLVNRADKISRTYRAGKPSAGVIVDPSDAMAYALARLPATFAACTRAFLEAAIQVPDFAPKSLLDAGCGPAGSAWAAREAWPSLETIHLLDSNPVFLALSADLAKEADLPLHAATRIKADLTRPDGWPRADLVVASYALAEIPVTELNNTVAALWSICEGLMVLIEPGTPDGWRRLLGARTLLLEAGAALVAPCPHSQTCPIAEPGDWCHFSQRLARSRDHRRIKAADAPFEDEKFVYLVVARDSVKIRSSSARILARPNHPKPAIQLKLCTPAGDLQLETIRKRDKTAFARARRLGWGDLYI